MKGLRDRIEPRLHDQVEALGFEVVELEWAGKSRRPILRLRVDRPDSVPGKGISVDDCAVVSRALEQWLDEEFPERYVLEVSSPGIERPLVRPRDWVRFAGQRVLVHGTRVLGDQGSGSRVNCCPRRRRVAARRSRRAKAPCEFVEMMERRSRSRWLKSSARGSFMSGPEGRGRGFDSPAGSKGGRWTPVKLLLRYETSRARRTCRKRPSTTSCRATYSLPSISPAARSTSPMPRRHRGRCSGWPRRT